MRDTVGNLSRTGVTLFRGVREEGLFIPSEYALYIPLSDETVSVNGARFDAAAQSVFLFAPGSIVFFDAPKDGFSDSYLFRFSGKAFFADRDFVSAFYPRAALPARVLSHIARISDVFYTEGDAETLAHLFLSELIVYLEDLTPAEFPDTRTREAIAYLTEHLTEEISLDALAERVGMSKFYLCRAFRRDSGLTPHAYLNCLRVLRAEKLLAGGMTAKAAGNAVGFGDYTTFFRTYKKLRGKAPSYTGEAGTI